MGKAWQQEFEVAGHSVSTVKKTEMSGGVELTFLFSVSPGPCPMK